MNIKKTLSIVSILILLSFSFGVNASPTSSDVYYECGEGQTNCGETRTRNTVIGALLLSGIIFLVVSKNKRKDNYTLAYHESFNEGKGITLAGKSRANKEAKFRLSTLSSNIEQESFLQDNFSTREEKSFSINLLKLEF